MPSKGSRSEQLNVPPFASEARSGPSPRSGEGGFDDIDRLTDASGLLSVISRRRSNGMMTFCIFKTFERDGKIEQTGFIPELLIPQYHALAKITCDRIGELRMRFDAETAARGAR